MNIPHFKNFLALLLVGLLLVPPLLNASAAVAPSVVSTSPANNHEYTHVTAPIHLTFNEEISYIDSAKIKLFFWNNGTYVETPLSSVTYSREKLTITPRTSLDYQKEYKVEIGDYAVQLKNIGYVSKYTFNFQTEYMNFYDLMVVDSQRLSGVLAAYSTKKLVVQVPKRNLEEYVITHRNKGTTEKSMTNEKTDSLTQFEVKTKGSDVAYVLLAITSGSKVQRIYMKNDEGVYGDEKRSFLLTLTKLPPSYDVSMTVFNRLYGVLDQKVVKVATDNKLYTEVKETLKYETDGKTFSLYDLLKKDSDFTKVLEENDMKTLKISVMSP